MSQAPEKPLNLHVLNPSSRFHAAGISAGSVRSANSSSTPLCPPYSLQNAAGELESPRVAVSHRSREGIEADCGCCRRVSFGERAPSVHNLPRRASPPSLHVGHIVAAPATDLNHQQWQTHSFEFRCSEKIDASETTCLPRHCSS